MSGVRRHVAGQIGEEADDGVFAGGQVPGDPGTLAGADGVAGAVAPSAAGPADAIAGAVAPLDPLAGVQAAGPAGALAGVTGILPSVMPLTGGPGGALLLSLGGLGAAGLVLRRIGRHTR